MKKYMKAIIRFMIKQKGNSDFKESVELLGVETMAELITKCPSTHLYIPSAKTMTHWLAVMVIRNEFKSEEEIKSKKNRDKVEKIANIFGIRKYRVLKIWEAGKWVR